jgi:hypothetical protein
MTLDSFTHVSSSFFSTGSIRLPMHWPTWNILTQSEQEIASISVLDPSASLNADNMNLSLTTGDCLQMKISCTYHDDTSLEREGEPERSVLICIFDR